MSPDVLPSHITKEDFQKWVKEKWGYKKIPMAGSTPAATALNFKTGDWASKIPKLIKENCISCNFCYFFCPDDVIRMVAHEDGKYYPEFNYYYCKGCAVCVYECPGLKGKKALVMEEIE